MANWESLNDINRDELVVLVERGPDYKSTPRLDAALAELAAALEDRDLAEVSGFSLDTMQVGTLTTPSGQNAGMIFGLPPLKICDGWHICGNCSKIVIKGIDS